MYAYFTLINLQVLKDMKLVMFPLVPVQGIHVVHGEPAVGTHEGFSCVHLPNVSITPMFRNCDFVTLGAPVLIFPPVLIKIGSSPGVPPPSLLETVMMMVL